MFKIQTFAHGTLAAALASTLLLSVPAHAGLLGGVTGSVSGAVGAGGSIGSSTGTGTSVGTSTSIGGSIGSSVGLGGTNAGASATGQADARQEAVLTRDEDLIRRAGGVKQATSARLREQGSVTRERATKLGADARASGDAAISSRRADVETDGSGSAQASRDGASVKLDVSARGSVER